MSLVTSQHCLASFLTQTNLKFLNVYIMNNRNSKNNIILLHLSIVWNLFGRIIKAVSTIEFCYFTALFGICLETNAFLNVYIMNNQNSECNRVLLLHSIVWHLFGDKYISEFTTLWIIKAVSTIEFCYISALFGICLESYKFPNVYIRNNENSEYNWVLLHYSIVWHLFGEKQISECRYYE